MLCFVTTAVSGPSHGGGSCPFRQGTSDSTFGFFSTGLGEPRLERRSTPGGSGLFALTMCRQFQAFNACGAS